MGPLEAPFQKIRIRAFLGDSDYYRRLWKIALPIVLQNFIMSSLNMVGAVMIGQLGETSVAAVGLSNQVYFLLNVMLFGITSGMAMFSAQFWGTGDITNIRRVLGLCLRLALGVGGFFAIAAVFFPSAVLRIYTNDPAVAALGSAYLRIMGLGFLFTATTFSFTSVLRSTGDVRTPLLVSITALSLNALLSYGLIFGRLGLPQVGLTGAAIAICIARFLECSLLLLLVYRRRTTAAASLHELNDINRAFVVRILKRSLPVAFNEVLWSLGITTYNIIYAHISTSAIAAMNISASIESLAFVLFIGISDATGIIVGNQIGAGQEERAYHDARRSLTIGAGGAVLMGALVLLASGLILSFYKVSPEVIEDARRILLVLASSLWLRVSNMTLFVGILRSGGDTRFGFLLDGGTIWLIGVPMAFLGGMVLHLPIYIVYLMVLGEELVKYFIAMNRFISRRWINNLARI